MVSASEAGRSSGPDASSHASAKSHDVHDAYQRHGPLLLRKAERILQNSDDACDMVQALFLDLMQTRTPNLEIKYLYRAVGNRCINYLRDRKNRERLLERQEQALRGPVRTRCDDQVMELDLLTRLAAKLDARCLEVLICRYWDDMTQDEIAEFLGTSRKTVGKRLGKIRELVSALHQDRPEVATGGQGRE